MATVQHTTLTSANVHEPKHITDTTIADAGKVITPSGSGASELRSLTPEEVGINFSYGEFGIDNNVSSFSVTAAVDPTLHTDSDFILLNSTRVPSSQDEINNMTFDGVNNTLTLTVSGVYRIGGWFNAFSDTANSKVGVKYTANGAPSGGVIITDIGTVGRTENLSGFGIVTLTAGTVIGISLACDKSANITITDYRMNLDLIREV